MTIDATTATHILGGLRDGLGVDDISVGLNIPNAVIRGYVARLRGIGALDEFYHVARVLWGMEREMKGRSE